MKAYAVCPQCGESAAEAEPITDAGFVAATAYTCLACGTLWLETVASLGERYDDKEDTDGTD